MCYYMKFKGLHYTTLLGCTAQYIFVPIRGRESLLKYGSRLTQWEGLDHPFVLPLVLQECSIQLVHEIESHPFPR
jgi:hypothetical protein